jgi:hypothetical protein
VSGEATDLVRRSPAADLQRVPFDNNADGVRDLLVYNRVTGAWAIYIGSRTGAFSNGPSGGWAAGWHVSAADFDGDAFDDFLLYSRASGAFYKAVNTGAGFRYVAGTAAAGFDARIVDFDADRKADVFFHNPGTGAWSACRSIADGTAGFDCIDGGWATGWHISTADFDGDRRTDLFLYAAATGTYFKVLTLADGTFAYSPGTSPAQRSVTVVDSNGEEHFYKTADSQVVKFCQVNRQDAVPVTLEFEEITRGVNKGKQKLVGVHRYIVPRENATKETTEFVPPITAEDIPF